MGREIKRVALDFSWPIQKVWYGYLNPYYCYNITCSSCNGAGVTASGQALTRISQLIKIAGEDSLCRPKDFTPKEKAQLIDIRNNGYERYYPHPYLCEAGIFDVGDDFHELTKKMSSDPYISEYSIKKSILQAFNLPENWGQCKECNGDGSIWDSKENENKAEKWTRIEPPVGPGYQLWETTSEGSPLSPVFDTPENLAHWLADNNASSFGDQTATYDEWLKFINDIGWACSGVIVDGKIESGVTAFVKMKNG